MLKNILKLNGIQKLTIKQLKEAKGSGGAVGVISGIETVPVEEEEPTVSQWKFRCYSPGTSSPYYYSNTDLSSRGYICYPV